MGNRLGDCRTLRDVLAIRQLTMEQGAVLGRVDAATISRICSGQARATPQTIVRLSQALGISARRMARLCDQAWRDREARQTSEQFEKLRRIDIDAMAGAQ
jgi:plasmid maintenance system antidote protein VapI